MKRAHWCEHLEKTSKYITVGYDFEDRSLTLRVQTWLCPECGVHGAHSEIIEPPAVARDNAARE